MKNKWQKMICIGLALVVLSLTVLACPGPDNGDNSQRPDPNKISLVTPERQAPTTFDLSGDIAVASATPEAGAVVTTNGMTLEVPPKAVAAETPVQVVTLANAPPTPGYDPDMDNSLAAAISLSPVYDLGPDGISFKKPVTVTLPYDASLLTSQENESYVQIAYYNGVSWVAVGGKVDTNNKTVTAQFTAFPGIAVSTVVLIGTWATFLTIASYKAYEHYVADPIAWGEAAKYITPKKSDDGSKVAEYVKRAIVGRKKNADGKGFTNIPLQDPKNPGQINPEAKEMLLNDLENVRIGFDETDKGQKSPVYPDYKSSTGGSFNDWVTPEEYFAKDMQFDCKNISNAYLTIVRSVGIEAKCVDGYTTARHVWVEMKIEGKPYVLDIDGGIQPLDVAYKKDGLKRPQGIKGEGYMYNENGQDPYKENWWLDELQVNVNDSKAYPGGEVVIQVFGAAGLALDIDLTIEGPDGSSTSYRGITDITSGIYRLTLPLKAGILPGVYVVTAANTEKDIFGIGIYSVVMPELFAGMITQEYVPGDVMIVNLQISPPMETRIEIEGIDGRWMTDADGFAFPAFPVPEDAKPGSYTLTVNAPLIGLTARVNYTVTVPPGIRVDIMPKEVAPGDIFVVNVIVQPPVVTKITIRGYDGRWMTDADGFATPTLKVSNDAAPGDYQIIVEAPDLGLVGSDIYTVAPVPQVNTSISLVGAELGISVEGSNDIGEYEAGLFVGGQYVRGSLDGNEVHTSGRVDTNSGPGTMYYDFVLSNDLAQVTSGSVKLYADNGETYYFTFQNLPRDRDYEASLLQQGLEGLAFSISGTAVSNYLSSFSVNSPELGSISRYFASNDSELIVVLLAATESQITQLIEQ